MAINGNFPMLDRLLIDYWRLFPTCFFPIYLGREGKNTQVLSLPCKWGCLLGDSERDKWEEKMYLISLIQMRQGVKRPHLPFLPSGPILLMFETMASILRWQNKLKERGKRSRMAEWKEQTRSLMKLGSSGSNVSNHTSADSSLNEKVTTLVCLNDCY